MSKQYTTKSVEASKSDLKKLKTKSVEASKSDLKKLKTKSVEASKSDLEKLKAKSVEASKSDLEKLKANLGEAVIREKVKKLKKQKFDSVSGKGTYFKYDKNKYSSPQHQAEEIDKKQKKK